MRALVVWLVLLTMLLQPTVAIAASGVPLSEQQVYLRIHLPLDKQKHMLAGLGIGFAGVLLEAGNPVFCAVLVGIGKELYDHYHGGYVELADATATALGGLFVLLLFADK